MNTTQAFATIVVATAATATLAALLARIGMGIRSRAYRDHEDHALPPFMAAWSALGAEGSPQDTAYIRANAALRPVHDAANALQDRSVRHILTAAWLLFIAFVSTAASLTVLASSEVARLASAAIHASAFALVFHHFRRSARFRAQWIRARSRIELLRQWTVVGAPLIASDPETLVEAFEREKIGIEVRLIATNSALHSETEALGEERLRNFAERLGKLRRIERAGALTYVRRRAVRQARWFTASHTRLIESAEQRGGWLLGLFALVFALGFLQLVGMVFLDWGETLTAHVVEFLVLLAIGASSCATAIYISQNGRSLSHRYEQQLRAIRQWFDGHGVFLEAQAASDGPLTGRSKARFIEALISFEKMMLVELLDWIRTTRADSMELAP